MVGEEWIYQINHTLTNSMALSEQTTESLKKAETHLRDALAFAARVEKPYVVRELGNILSHIDNIQATDSLFDRMSNAIDRMEDDDKP